MITLEHFDEVDMRVGTITAVSLNKRARKPAYKITVDLGDFGTLPDRQRTSYVSIPPMFRRSLTNT